jgi:hypothetical protein
MPGNPIGFAVIAVESGVYGGMEVATLAHLHTALYSNQAPVMFAKRKLVSQKLVIMVL